MKRTIATVAPLLLSLAGCGSFYAEAEQPSACIQLTTPQPFTVNPNLGGGTVGGSVNLGLSDALPKELFNGSPGTNIVSFQSLTLTLNGPGGADASWLRNLKVVATSGTLPPVTLIDYTPATPPTTRTFTLGPADPGNNLVQLIQDGNLAIGVTASYQDTHPPTPGIWTGSVTACFSAKVKKYFNQF